MHSIHKISSHKLSKSQSKNHLNTSEINTFFTTLNPQIMFIYRSHIFYHQKTYDFWDMLPLYQQITPILHLYRSYTTPYTREHLVFVLSLSCKNAQKTSYLVINTIILYYYGMFSYGGIFTFSVTAVFSPGQGCVLLKRKPPNLNHRFYAHFINCIKFPHNSL